MRSDKSDVYKFRSKLNNDYKSVIVPFYVEDIVLITHIIYRVECLLNVSQVDPSGAFDLLDPVLDGRACLRM